MSQAEFLIQPLAAPATVTDLAVTPLSAFSRGDQGVIVRIGVDQEDGAAIADAELERRLLELGFVEGARLELVHEGAFGRDPIAVRVDDMCVALRRREASNVFVRRTGGRRS
jgi:ferrous iron transport protein A